VSPRLDDRLRRLQEELSDHARIARHLGLDFERPIQSLGDGYPENATAWVGKITERLLKQLWRYHDVAGDPGSKSLGELIKGCRPYIRSGTVLDALGDIQRLRNRSAHDGYQIAEEDALAAVRRLLEVLAWFTHTGSDALTGAAPRLEPIVARHAEFLAGLYLTMGYRLIKRFELSAHTVYQLFCREVGVRSDYVEIVLTRDLDELRQVWGATGGELLRTQLPKMTRFLVLEEGQPTDLTTVLGHADYRVVAYDGFLDTIIDIRRHLADIDAAHPHMPRDHADLRPLSAHLMRTDDRTGEIQHEPVGDVLALLKQSTTRSANLLVVGRPGSGKSTLLKQLVTASSIAPTHRHRFYFDLHLKRREENFISFVTRTLAPCMDVDPSRVFDVFHYLIRSGSVLCALDGIDEAVQETTLDGFLALFAELAQVLSAESAVVMSSRVSFLEDSPYVRQLLDTRALVSERLVQQLHAHGVDPLRIPRFSVLRLHDLTVQEDTAGSPLELRLASEHADPATDQPQGQALVLEDLVSDHVRRIARTAGMADLATLAALFGRGFLIGQTTFTFIELCQQLGMDMFEGARLDYDSFRLRALFYPVESTAVTFRHSVFQEFFAAEYLRDARHRDELAGPGQQVILTEQVRAFLHHAKSRDEDRDDCLLAAGAYLVGPSHNLLLRRVERAVKFDRYPVTVRRYQRFLEAVAQHGSAAWDHPAKPAEYSHEPWYARLRYPDLYDNPRYAEHPAVCINWWSAFAFARFEGKRLPTALEWEAAARGQDARLFPWGDQVQLEAVNCADAWSGRALVTYEVWKAEIDSGGLRAATSTSVHEHPQNRSPIGVHGMAGNVWEWTSTVFEHLNEAAMCGGSYDNPYRAVQACSKGLFRRRGSSNAVGFRCVEDV
jgi:hypothetical protein